MLSEKAAVRSWKISGRCFFLHFSMDFPVEIENPGGVFGVRLYAPSGKGEITLADGVFYADKTGASAEGDK